MMVCFEKITEFLGTEKACSRALAAMLHKWFLVKVEKVGVERVVRWMRILLEGRC